MFRNTSEAISKDEIKEIEEKIGVALPKQLVKHYLKYNGGAPIKNFLFSRISDIETSVQSFLPMKYKGGDGLTVEDMYLRFAEKGVIPKKYLPFAMDYGGNLFCIDLEDDKVVIIWMDTGDIDESKIRVLSRTFNEFISCLEEPEE